MTSGAPASEDPGASRAPDGRALAETVSTPALDALAGARTHLACSGHAEATILDLIGPRLSQLPVFGDSAVLEVLRRLNDDLRNPDHIVAGFDSAF
jgi:hypothetical protein